MAERRSSESLRACAKVPPGLMARFVDGGGYDGLSDAWHIHRKDEPDQFLIVLDFRDFPFPSCEYKFDDDPIEHAQTKERIGALAELIIRALNDL